MVRKTIRIRKRINKKGGSDTDSSAKSSSAKSSSSKKRTKRTKRTKKRKRKKSKSSDSKLTNREVMLSLRNAFKELRKQREKDKKLSDSQRR